MGSINKSNWLRDGFEIYGDGCSSDEVLAYVRLTKPPSSVDSALLLERLLGASPAMIDVLAQVRKVAPSSATVLITGESGTGKEVLAMVIHGRSKRSKHPFVVLNCGAVSPQLIESELFGHEKGSFTGAINTHRGVFEQASGGTLFLDEVTEMPLELQVKLLRVIETRRFVRVGAEHEQETDIRIIAATNRRAEEISNPELFRADLLYRLQVFPIELPPLRKRKEDIRHLARHFVRELNEAERENKAFSRDAFLKLESHSWPGNLRELKNVVQRAYIMADRIISVEHLPPGLSSPLNTIRQQGDTLMVDIGAPLAEVEKHLLIATLAKHKGRKKDAANALGISTKTLYNKLQQYQEQASEQIKGK